MSADLISILYITVRSDRSGGPQHLSDLLTSIKQVKSATELKISVASPTEEPFGTYFKNESLYFIPIPVRSFSLITALKLLKHAKEQKINLVHSHGRGAGLYSRFLKLFGYKVIHTFHGIHLEPTLIGRIKYLVDKFIARFTDCFICVSYDEKESVLNRKLASEERIRIVQNGVDVKRIDRACESCSKEISRKKLGIDNNIFACGTLTRLTHVKGLDLLIHFASEYYLKFPKSNLKFYLVGEGEKKEEYTEMVNSLQLNDRIIFLGPSDKPIEFLRAIDCYTSFSRWEGLPLSVLEAMTNSLPCILSDVTGHRELAGGNAAALFSLTDVDRFIAILHTLSTHKNAAIELGANARNKILKEYTVSQMAEKTLRVYESLLY